MGRIRTLKPEFWTDEKLSALPEFVHMLAAALLNYSDDEGYFNANLTLVKGACSPLREPSVSIHGALSELSLIDYLRFGKGSDGRCYGWIVNFKKHQRVNRPSASKIRPLVANWCMMATFDGEIHGGLTEHSLKAHGGLTEDSLTEGNREQGTGNGKESDSVSTHGGLTEYQGGGFSPAFMMFWSTYPRHRRMNMALAAANWHPAIAIAASTNESSAQQAEDWILKRTRAYAKSWHGQSKYAPACDKWLASAKFSDADEAWEENADDAAPAAACQPMSKEDLENWRATP